MGITFKAFFLLLVVSSGVVFGQNLEIKGIIRDNSKVGIPCAMISLKNKAEGCIADEKGNYRLNVASNDTLIVSSPGFEPSVISMNNAMILSPFFVYLSPKKNFQALTIENSGSFQYSSKEGIFDQPSNAVFTTVRGQSVVIKIENSAKKEALLSKIHANFGRKSISQTKLRVRVFSVNPLTGEPFNDLLTKNVIVPVTSSQFLFDIESYKIPIPMEGCFVGFDWIEMPKQKPSSASHVKADSLVKPSLKTTSKVCSAKTYSRVFASEWRSWVSQIGTCPSNVFIAATLKYQAN
ncbi:carboxypeptidase-like regulatory domain-containing protein [Runella sp.]|uniref:carboxypeptidase-like regulatory domain-containing protein n=1 Tax=Runella sp. TaxID=1960881 RepID=UPI003D0DCE55